MRCSGSAQPEAETRPAKAREESSRTVPRESTRPVGGRCLRRRPCARRGRRRGPGRASAGQTPVATAVRPAICLNSCRPDFFRRHAARPSSKPSRVVWLLAWSTECMWGRSLTSFRSVSRYRISGSYLLLLSGHAHHKLSKRMTKQNTPGRFNPGLCCCLLACQPTSLCIPGH